jgi:hypothetical protein
VTVQVPYTTQLGAGLGLVDETQSLLDLWHPGMTTQALYDVALESGQFPNVTARRLRNIIAECFAPRYIKPDPQPALWLHKLHRHISTVALKHLFFLYTARANVILRDFVVELYWDRYASGHANITTDDAKEFVERAVRDGKTKTLWSESVIKRVTSYLVSVCVHYDLLRLAGRKSRDINAVRISNCTVIVLAYELHLQGIADNNLINHSDWQLYGLQPEDVRDELKRLSVHKFWIIQTAADVVSISWAYKTMEEVVDVIIETGL